MKTSVVIGSTLIIVGILATAGFAQGVPGQFQMGMQQGMQPMAGPDRPGGQQPGPGGHSQAAVKCSETGVFALDGGALTKFETGTLKELGKLDLLGKIETSKPDACGPDMNRPGPIPERGIMLFAKNGADIIVILGDQFFRIDAATFKIVTHATIAKPERPAHSPGAPGARDMGVTPRPSVDFPELQGRTLYMTQADGILAIDIDTGKVTGQAALHAAPAPAK
ncbi:MAG: hypothetical protein ABFD49_02015 [Armatimonadota bacterium]|nr:hypothetical protein [bacterium]